MSALTPRDAAWWPDDEVPPTRNRARWALWFAILAVLAGAGLLVVVFHLAPAVGAAGGCGGG